MSFLCHDAVYSTVDEGYMYNTIVCLSAHVPEGMTSHKFKHPALKLWPGPPAQYYIPAYSYSNTLFSYSVFQAIVI